MKNAVHMNVNECEQMCVAGQSLSLCEYIHTCDFWMSLAVCIVCAWLWECEIVCMCVSISVYDCTDRPSQGLTDICMVPLMCGALVHFRDCLTISGSSERSANYRQEEQMRNQNNWRQSAGSGNLWKESNTIWKVFLNGHTVLPSDWVTKRMVRRGGAEDDYHLSGTCSLHISKAAHGSWDFFCFTWKCRLHKGGWCPKSQY